MRRLLARALWSRTFLHALVCVALLVLAVPLLLRAPEPVVRLGQPRTVVTCNPKMGVHTRLTDEVEEWKIQRTLAMVREMGAPWVVEYFPWGYYEPEKGRFDWSHADLVVNHAVAQGLTVIGRIDYVPAWARPAETTPRYLDEERFTDLGDFVYAFVKRFGQRVPYVVIWNEPNLSFEWGYRPVDPEAYTRLLRICYQRAKEADPAVQVVAAGLAPTTVPEGNEWGMDDLLFLQRMYDAGARGCFDAMAVHAYGLTFAPDDPPSPDLLNFSRAELTHEVMVRNGDSEVPCLITEGGWNDHPRWTRAVRPAERIAYTIRAYEKARQEWPWCRAVALWAFRFPWPAQTYQDYFTFVSVGFTPKPVYLAVQRYAQGESIDLTGMGPW
ncbi:MAG: beta-galactosidase [Anaerolineae bacterium]|nr:beta-galactosidase [Anaerolineae bacterium]